MINPVQIGGTVAADVQDCAELAAMSAVPFADALSTAMTLDKKGNAKPIVIAASLVTGAEMVKLAKDSDNDLDDNPSAEITAMFATLASTQQAIASPQATMIASDALATVSADINTIEMAKDATSAQAKPSLAPDAKSAAARVALPMTEKSASSSLAEEVQAIPSESLVDVFQAPIQDPTASTTQAAQPSIVPSEEQTPLAAEPAAAEESRPLPNGATVIAVKAGELISPKRPAQQSLTNESNVAANQSALQSLEDVTESPARIDTQGEDAEIHLDRDTPPATPNEHPEVPDLRRNAVVAETAQRDSVAAPTEAAKPSPDLQAARVSRPGPATPCLPPAEVVDAVTPSVVPLAPLVVSTAENGIASGHESSRSTLLAGDKVPAADSVSTVTTSSDIPHAHDLIQSARMLERLGRSEIQVGINTEMGHLEVRTVLQNANVSATFGVERAALGALISAELPSLQNALAKNHLDLSSASVNTNSAGTGDLGRHAQQQRNQNGAPGYTLPSIYSEAEERTRPTSLLTGTAKDSQYSGGLSVRV